MVTEKQKERKAASHLTTSRGFFYLSFPVSRLCFGFFFLMKSYKFSLYPSAFPRRAGALFFLFFFNILKNSYHIDSLEAN